MDEPVYSSGGAAGKLHITRERLVQFLRESGLDRTIARDSAGRRIFSPDDVEMLRRAREGRRTSGGSDG